MINHNDFFIFFMYTSRGFLRRIWNKMKNIIGFRTLKTGIGATVAMLIAAKLNLSFSASAGIITILSIQNTKKASCEIAIRRLIATIIALAIGGSLFQLLGFNALVFGLYLIIYIPVTVKLKVTEGIVPASVLVTHLLGEGALSTGLFINELLLMIIGAGVALIFNVYMPSIEKELLKDKRHIEEGMYDILMNMSLILKGDTTKKIDEHQLEKLKSNLILGKKRAYQHSNNYLINEVAHYEKYFIMREGQFHIIEYMMKHFDNLYMNVEQGKKVGELAQKLAESTKGKVTVEQLMQELEDLRLEFKGSSLPQDRDEFENRAMLYQFLNDIELFIMIKVKFKQELTPSERRQYNKYYDIY